MGGSRGIGQQGESGIAAILFAVSLVVLIGMVAMVVDVGFAYYQKQRLQDALDLAAIAGARALTNGTGNQVAAVNAAQAAIDLNYGISEHLTVASGCATPAVEGVINLCLGSYDAGTANNRPALASRFTAQGSSCTTCTSVRLFAHSEAPSFFARIFNVTVLDIGAVSTAVKSATPLARLTIRSSLATLNTSQSALLGPVFGLLGGGVNVSAVSWTGLVGADVNLLSYLDGLISGGGLGVSIAAGDYTSLLSTSISVSRLLTGVVSAVGQNSTAGLALNSFIGSISAGIKSTTVKLGSLIDLETGTPAAGLDTNIALLDFLQGVLVAANGASALSTTGLTLSTAGVTSLLNSVGGSLPNYGTLSSLLSALSPLTSILGGAATVTVKLKVIEPPQLSAIGNPADAKAATDKRAGAGAIYVRTGQIRLYVSIQLPILNTLSSLLNAVATLANSSQLVSILNSALSLNLFDLLTGLLPIPTVKNVLDIKILPQPRIDVSVDLAYGEAYVTDYTCPASGSDSLSINAASSVGLVNVGTLDPTTVFSSTTPPAVNPVTIIDIGTKSCTVTCLLGLCGTSNCGAHHALTGGGLGLYANATVAGSQYSYAYSALPKLDEATNNYHSFSISNVIGGLKTTLAGLHIDSYKPAAGNANLISTLLTGTATLTSTIVSILNPVITLLAAVLDPIVNFLLNLLGLDVANIDVGANMTCNAGARLAN
ncbi:pilus assembly protein TadG-related protein [Zavarzinia sp.]|uniref:pilus assembly protein TadG-related protein n=1 Tax=Zavarzinia sp. TaxID=2027920 RepID=UPI00356AE492